MNNKVLLFCCFKNFYIYMLSQNASVFNQQKAEQSILLSKVFCFYSSPELDSSFLRKSHGRTNSPPDCLFGPSFQVLHHKTKKRKTTQCVVFLFLSPPNNFEPIYNSKDPLFSVMVGKRHDIHITVKLLIILAQKAGESGQVVKAHTAVLLNIRPHCLLVQNKFNGRLFPM